MQPDGFGGYGGSALKLTHLFRHPDERGVVPLALGSLTIRGILRLKV